jgi:hypothetical protein
MAGGDPLTVVVEENVSGEPPRYRDGWLPSS